MNDNQKIEALQGIQNAYNAPESQQQKTTALTTEQYAATLETIGPIIEKLNASRTISGKAKAASEVIFKSFQTTVLESLTDAQLSELDIKLSDIQSRAITAKDKQELGRKPLTQAFDTIRSKFTAEENIVNDIKTKCASYRGKIMSEVSGRLEKKNKASADKINQDNETIDYRKAYNLHLTSALTLYIVGVKNGLRKRLNESKDLAALEKEVTKWQPELLDSKINEFAKDFHFGFLYLKEAPLFELPLVDLRNKYNSEVLPERALILSEIALKRAGLEAEELAIITELEIKVAIEQEKESTEIQASADKIMLMMEAEATTTIIEPGGVFSTMAGMKVPKLYIPANHAHWAKLITWYIADQMPHLTPEELEKKFGFILTKANAVMNATDTWIADVPRENDFNKAGGKRGRPKKEIAA